MIPDRPDMVTLKALLSEPALIAWGAADYRLRHNARYRDWPESKRIRYCLKKAFEAVAGQDKP